MLMLTPQHLPQLFLLLDGRALHFKYDRTTNSYLVQVQDLERTNVLVPVENLVEDMDLRALCPPVGVKSGETWSVPIAWLQALVHPGGDLQPEFRSSAGEDAVATQSLAETGGSLPRALLWKDAAATDEDACTLTSEGREVTDSGSIHRFRFEFDVERSFDLDELLAGNTPGEDLGWAAILEQSGEIPITVDLEVEGRGVWDEQWQRVAELELEFVCVIVAEMDVDGQGTIRMEFELSGDASAVNKTR